VRLKLLVALAIGGIAMPVGAAYAGGYGEPPTGVGTVSDGTITVGVGLAGVGGQDGTAGTTGAALVSPYRYQWVQAVSLGNQGTGGVCAIPGDPFGGLPWIRNTYDLAGALVDWQIVCLPRATTQSTLPALPPVPTIADIWAVALKAIPRPSLGVDPQAAGLTGLDTRLWYDGPETVSIGATIGEWTVIGTAHLVSATFDTGDGTSTAAAPHPQTNVTYERKGDRTLVITARWEADVVMTGPGITARPTAIGAALLRTTQPYHVREVRSVLVP
jgi:hypothetical protein